MNATPAIPVPSSAVFIWLSRARALAIALAIALLLAWVSGRWPPHLSIGDPVIIFSIPHVIGTIVVLVGGALAAALLAGPRHRRDAIGPLAIVALGWLIWSSRGGTMDDWLTQRNTIPNQPGRAGPYLALLPDYALLALLVMGVKLLAGLVEKTGSGRSSGFLGFLLPLGHPATPSVESHAGASAAVLAKFTRNDPRITGLLALGIVVTVASLLISRLFGALPGKTLTGQVYFAVGAGFWIAVWVARYLTGIDRGGWLWPAPILVGLVGVALAAARPALPGEYQNNNISPAWNLARPLPIEMVGVGLLAISWHFRREPEPREAQTAGGSS